MSSQDSPDGRVGLAHETFTLVLDKVIKSGPGPRSLQCTFDYTWDFPKNMGFAHLSAIGGVTQSPPLPITLNPAGILHTLSFIGYGGDKPFILPDGTEILLYRIWLILDLRTGQRKASLMIGIEGNLIIATENYSDKETKDLLAKE